MITQHDVPLADLCTLGLGGPARTVRVAESEADVLTALEQAPASLVLGGGSNVVLPDDGVDDVLLLRTRGIDGLADSEQLEVAAGEDWDQLVAATVGQGLVGLEALSGVPGSTGASPVQNIGAYGSELADTLLGVRALHRLTGEVLELDAQACELSYRHSRFKAEAGDWVVLAVRFQLHAGSLGAPVRYAELARALGVSLGERAPADEVREAVLQLRRSKGMVLDAGDPDTRSVGSFFTNPLLDPAEVPAGAPTWPAGDLVKVPAAWLVEHAGFSKGWGDGPVGLSSKHTLALVHRGGGSTGDLLSVARTVRDGVRDRFGVLLVPEPVLVGTQL